MAKNSTMLLRQLGVAVVITMTCVSFVQAQTVPIDVSSRNKAAIVAAGRAYSLDYLNVPVNSAAAYETGGATVNDNPATAFLQQRSMVGISAIYAPVSKDLYLGNISFNVGVSPRLALYVSMQNKVSGDIPLVPVVSGKISGTDGEWQGTNTAFADCLYHAGVLYRIGAHRLSYGKSRLLLGAGISYLQSQMPTGNWSDSISRVGNSMALNAYGAYDMTNEAGEGFLFSSRLTNIGLSKIVYYQGITRNWPLSASVSGQYTKIVQRNKLIIGATFGHQFTQSNAATVLSTSQYVDATVGYGRLIGRHHEINLNTGYCNNPLYRAMTMSLGMRYRNSRLSLCYVAANNDNPFVHQLQMGLSVGI